MSVNNRAPKVGDLAPEFSSTDWKGQPFALSSLKGSRVWLAFFRYASCPLCNLRVSQMIRIAPELSASGLKVVAIFQSPADSIRSYVGKQSPPFTVLADPEERIYSQYHLGKSASGTLDPRNLIEAAKSMAAGFLPGKMEGTLTRLPGDFLIDESGQVADRFDADRIADHIPLERVLAFAKAGS